MILAAVSLGELIDKITILEIKSQHLNGHRLENVNRELACLNQTLHSLNINIDLEVICELKLVNSELWNAEDEIRDCEQLNNFGPKFVEIARSIYRLNDQRFMLKREINLKHGSWLIEEKLYRKC